MVGKEDHGFYSTTDRLLMSIKGGTRRKPGGGHLAGCFCAIYRLSLRKVQTGAEGRPAPFPDAGFIGAQLPGVKTMRHQLTAIIEREGSGYVSLCPELDIASQGDTVEQARDNLREALELFFATASPTEIKTRLHGEVYVTRQMVSWAA
jgi:predicted RNase H-like HicB family nuclease